LSFSRRVSPLDSDDKNEVLIMAKKAIDLKTAAIIGAVLIGGAYFLTGGTFQFAAEGGAPPTGDGGEVGYATTLTFNTLNVYGAAGGDDDTRAWLVNTDNSIKTAEFTVDTEPDTIGTLPNTYSGYLLAGNDNYVVSSDLGSEVWLTKHPVNWKNDPAPDAGQVLLYNESTFTIRVYDSGTEETTPNITIGSGAAYTRLEVEIEAGDNACLCNPDFKKLAFAWNATNTTSYNKMEYIRPKGGYYTGTTSSPEFASGSLVSPTMYLLPPEACVCDSGVYKFPIVVQAKAGANPTNGNGDAWDGDNYAIMFFDYTRYIDDTLKFSEGWEDASDQAADADIGQDSLAQHARITVM